MSKKKAATPAAQDPLDAFVQQATENQWNAIAMMFWLARHKNPTFTVQVTPKDIEGFTACAEYLDVSPTVRIFRPEGKPARAAQPATANRSALPARAAEPPQNYVVIQMTDADGNAIVPVENNEADHQAAAQAKRVALLRDQAPEIANQLQGDLNNNMYSNDTITRAIAALRELARPS